MGGQLFTELIGTPGLDSNLLERLQKWIFEASEPELFRINLIKLGKAWDIPLKAAITHFLYMTRAGIVDLSWDIHCPQCNVVLAREESLRHAGPIHYCKYCLKDVESKLDDHFEVTFTLNARIRPVRGHVRYEPSANVEIFLKEKISPGATVAPAVVIPNSVMRLRLVSWPPLHVQIIPSGKTLTEPSVRFQGDEYAQFPEFIPAGSFHLTLKNDTAAEVNLMIENHDMREYLPNERAERLTGFQVVSVPAFRVLFGSETLSDRESLKIRDATLVFTDIKGSTSLYQRVGDVRAYKLVRDHFEILFDSILNHGGVVIKTIGDSVMASFLTPEQAVEGMLEVQKCFDTYNRKPEISDGIHIRAGIHRGPVIAVTLNDRLDYFGTTVNEAARIEGVCDANELVVSDSIMKSPGIHTLLEGFSIEIFETSLVE